MFINKDKLYLQTSDIPTLKDKISRAIELSRELLKTLNDLDGYDIEFEIKSKKEET